jgi:hypothetical protein
MQSFTRLLGILGARVSAQVKGKTKIEGSGAFSLTTSSLTMETMTVTRAMAWLETQIMEMMAVTRAMPGDTDHGGDSGN